MGFGDVSKSDLSKLAFEKAFSVWSRAKTGPGQRGGDC